jgi:cyanate lyase
MTTKQEAAQAVVAAKASFGLTWTHIAEAIGRPPVWTTTALLGQHPVPAAEAQTAGSLLELSDAVVAALQLQPTRGALETAVPVDPAIKELIHEQFGDAL